MAVICKLPSSIVLLEYKLALFSGSLRDCLLVIAVICFWSDLNIPGLRPELCGALLRNLFVCDSCKICTLGSHPDPVIVCIERCCMVGVFIPRKFTLSFQFTWNAKKNELMAGICAVVGVV